MSFNILATGRCTPSYRLTNDELSTMVETNDEWISTRTGIKERRIMTEETKTQLCVEAARKTLQKAGVDAAELDLIICSTVAGEYITPSQACMIQREIGAHCPAFDVNAACSGFLYALDVADGYFVRGRAKYILVVSMEAMSRLVDWQDRSTCVLFGDGCGAALLTQGDGLLAMKLTAKGNTAMLNIGMPTEDNRFYRHPSQRAVLSMSGQEVFKFAIKAIVKDLRELTRQVGMTPGDLDCIVPHQANIRIIESASALLKIPMEKFFLNIAAYGNTSSASVPMALDEALETGAVQPGQTIALTAFGGGLTTGTCIIRI